MPYYKGVKTLSRTTAQYLEYVQSEYDRIYLGKERYSMRVTPFDRTGFALSDELPMLTYNIGNGI